MFLGAFFLSSVQQSAEDPGAAMERVARLFMDGESESEEDENQHEVGVFRGLG